MNAQHAKLLRNSLTLFVVVALMGWLMTGMASRADAAREASATQDALVVSPVEGFFLVSEYPGGEPVVEPGDEVSETTIVGYVQSGEVTPVTAGVRGVVVEVMFTDMSPVAKGDPLFRVTLLN